MEDNLRKVERITPDGNEVIRLMELKDGDIFQMTEDDGKLLGPYKANGSPTINSKGVAGINGKLLDEEYTCGTVAQLVRAFDS